MGGLSRKVLSEYVGGSQATVDRGADKQEGSLKGKPFRKCG